MLQTNGTLTIDTPGKGLVEVGAAIVEWVASQGLANGVLTLFCRHTSASLLI